VISSVYAGIGGVFFAHQNGFINSDTFVFSLSVSFLTSALMGGSGTLFGPLVGSVILNLIPTVFAGLQEYQLYIYGGIILGQRFRGSNHIRRPRQACRTKCG
jgi:ABC-type branched-subunit amino acid transport system permease subunit